MTQWFLTLLGPPPGGLEHSLGLLTRSALGKDSQEADCLALKKPCSCVPEDTAPTLNPCRAWACTGPASCFICPSQNGSHLACDTWWVEQWAWGQDILGVSQVLPLACFWAFGLSLSLPFILCLRGLNWKLSKALPPPLWVCPTCLQQAWLLLAHTVTAWDWWINIFCSSWVRFGPIPCAWGPLALFLALLYSLTMDGRTTWFEGSFLNENAQIIYFHWCGE